MIYSLDTFADAAKYAQLESQERPNDPISKRGLEANNENDQIVWEKDGIEYEPILWFGDSDIPEEPWMISTSMSEEKLGFWFEVEPWFILESIIEDCDDIFLTWYIAECGLGVPDIESIREKCPIVFDETCTMDEIALKMYEFFKGIKESDS